MSDPLPEGWTGDSNLHWSFEGAWSWYMRWITDGVSPEPPPPGLDQARDLMIEQALHLEELTVRSPMREAMFVTAVTVFKRMVEG